MEKRQNNVYLSIIIPAYNEERRIGGSIEKIVSFLKDAGYRYEIVIVDDGSHDGTIHLVNRYIEEVPEVRLLQNHRNRGKGYTVRHGILAAEGELILYADADLAVPIDELPRFIEACEEGADLAIGDRYMEESDIIDDQPLYRRLIGYFGGLYVKMMILKNAPDTQCGFKCFRRDAARKLFSLMRINGGMFDVELIYLARKLGYKIKQIPVAWSHCPGSNINALKCILTDPVSLLSIRANDFLKRYRIPPQ